MKIATSAGRGLGVVFAAALLAVVMMFGSAVPYLVDSGQLAVAEADEGKPTRIKRGVGWFIVQEVASAVIEFVVNSPSPNNAQDVLNKILASAPHFSSVSDPQQIVWQAAPIAGPANGVIYGNATNLFNSMAAAGQRTGNTSLRNGVYTVTLAKGGTSKPPVLTISNAAITKRIMVLAR
ncbi:MULTISPECIES: hypothetical protein [Mycobacteriaceae]|uniref:hypothetical protein n=1 Tax=Mycobacteriaceae TaxID=1762 RepID=UPI00092CD892|nr:MULTISPECIES: hypothetical protein [Mycobacteriaceae]MCB0940687.1 hypothetical protein [Mycobacterium sp.]MDM1915747.1 hypothetical protein [Mycobacteroides abscessus]MDM1928164.1 hypothetical protein [Mycobacteroides abscessus]MDM1932502.1 hypothetical protein [Mycobacteroides abscessus]MDM1938159.1 hypothetical protein [Mycobacteroides abscessus]